MKAKRQAIEEIDEHAIHCRRGGEILLSRQGKGRREGMWRLPVRDPEMLVGLPPLHRRKYGITRYRVTLHVHGCPPDHPAARPGDGEEWVAVDELAARVVPPADRAALAALAGGAEEIA